jgi:hypothetical protein
MITTHASPETDLADPSARRRFRAATIETALADARRELGEVEIVEANRIRRGGVGGFFATDLGIEIVVRLVDESSPDGDDGRAYEDEYVDSTVVGDRRPAPVATPTDRPAPSAQVSSSTTELERLLAAAAAAGHHDQLPRTVGAEREERHGRPPHQDIPIAPTRTVTPSFAELLSAQEQRLDTARSEHVAPREPATTEPATIEPVTIEPVTIEPVTIEPVTIEPVTIEPVTIEPATIEPATIEPATIEPATIEPATIEPVTIEPVTIEPVTIEPATIEPATIEPATIEPATIEPATIEPATIEAAAVTGAETAAEAPSRAAAIARRPEPRSATPKRASTSRDPWRRSIDLAAGAVGQLVGQLADVAPVAGSRVAALSRLSVSITMPDGAVVEFSAELDG